MNSVLSATLLRRPVGLGRSNDRDDIRTLKTMLHRIGRLPEPEESFSGDFDTPLEKAVIGFQRENGLEVDGRLMPGGPTVNAMKRAASNQMSGVEGGGFEGARTTISSSRSSLNPLLAMRRKMTGATTTRRASGRTMISKKKPMTTAKPGPGNLRGAQFFMEKPKFWRRDCIVGLQVRSDSSDSFGKFVDFGFRYIKPHINRYALWSLSGGGSSDAPSFIQYTHDCDRRLEMTRSWIHAFGQIDGDAAHLRVLEKRFEPGPKTIDSHGSSWLDPIPRHLR